MPETDPKKPIKVVVAMPAAADRRERDKLAATEITITSAADYTLAIQTLQVMKARERFYTAKFLEARKPLVAAQKAAVALEKEFLAPLRDRIALIEAGARAWRSEQEARERALREQAQREAEAKALAERQTQVAALEAAAKATASRIEKKALRMQAKQLEAAPVVAAPAAIATTVPSVAGAYERVTYRAEVIDFEALVIACAIPLLIKRFDAACAMKPEPTIDNAVRAWLAAMAGGAAQLDYLLPNQPRLDAIAVECRDQMPVPGVVGRAVSRLVVRSAVEDV